MRGCVRVAVIDDHPLYRHGIVSIMKDEPDISVVGQGASADDAMRVAKEAEPDVMLLDISMPGNGLLAAQAIVRTHPRIKILMLTVSEDANHVAIAMKAGAAGYILKGVTGVELVGVVRQVATDTRYVSPALAARLLTQQTKPQVPEKKALIDDLTAREGQIMTLVARGMTNKEIGLKLALSEKTVKHHMTNIMQKLQVRNRIEVTLIASGKARDTMSGDPADRAS